MSGSYMSLHCDRRKQLNLIFDRKKINKTKKSATASNKTKATTERKRVCDFSSFFDLNHNPPPTPVEKGWRITYHSSFCRHQKQKATNGRVCVSDSSENCQCFKNKTKQQQRHISQLLYHIPYSHETESKNTYHSTTDCTEQIHVPLPVVIILFEFSISSRSFRGLSRVKQNKKWIPLFQSPASVFGIATNEYKQAGYACFSSQQVIYNSYWNNSQLSEEAKEWKNKKWLMGFRWTR